METLDRTAIIERLVQAGNRRDVATLYADCYLEYVEASANIQQHGIVVLHPRTNTPLTNPYAEIRDRALRKLQAMQAVKGVEGLW